MGLDSYFIFEGDKTTWPKVDITVALCGGMFSGTDNGSSPLSGRPKTSLSTALQ